MSRGLALAVALASCGPTHRERCERAGGRVVAVNCREEPGEICTPLDFGGVSTEACISTTSTTCDHTCVGASPEAP